MSCISAAVTVARSALGAMTRVGSPDPAGKCWPSTSSPITESGLPVNESVCERPRVFSWPANAMATPSSAVVTSQVDRGRRPTLRATLDHTPDSFSSTSSWRGTLGQNTQRPSSTSNAI